MRRFVVALALLALAAPASGKTLIVSSNVVSSDPAYMAADHQVAAFKRMMKKRGGTYNEIHVGATRTLWMQTGLQVWGTPNLASAATEQFDAVVIVNFHPSSTKPTGSSPDSLTLVVKWPSVPVVFLGYAGHAAGKWTSVSNACSTGVKSLGTSYSSVRRTYVAYPVGSTNPWKSLVLNLWPAVVLGTQPTGTQLRPVVAFNYSSVTPGGTPQVAAILRTDADSTGYTSAGNDSILLWVRTMTPTDAIPSPKPIIFAEIGGDPPDVGLMGMAMQMADSASGGNVWDADDAKPIEVALVITATTSRGHYLNDLSSVTSSHLGGGPFCYADSCDTSNVLTGLDSLGALAGLKTTFYVDPCSLATYASVKNWFPRAGKFKVGMQPVSGTLTGATARNDSTFPSDPLGKLRTRLAGTGGRCSNASDTMQIACNVRRGFNIIANHFGRDAVDNSILPAFSDWSPVAYTRSGGGPGRDSVAAALWAGGARVVIIRPEHVYTNPGISSSILSGTVTQYSGATSPALDPWGYGPDAERVPVYANPTTRGRTIGEIRLVAERGQEVGPNVSYSDPQHDIRSEMFLGALGELWYGSPIRYYTHSFFTGTNVLSVSLGRLGGTGTSSPARIGWWRIKHMHNEFRAANNLGWVDANGRKRHMFDWAFVEDLQP